MAVFVVRQSCKRRNCDLGIAPSTAAWRLPTGAQHSKLARGKEVQHAQAWGNGLSPRRIIEKLGDTTPGHLAIPGTRPGQIALLQADPVLAGISLVDLTDVQVEAAARLAAQLMVTGVEQTTLRHRGRVGLASAITLQVASGSLTLIALPCGDAEAAGVLML